MTVYSVDAGHLVYKVGDSEVWRGLVEGSRVLIANGLPESNDAIVLLDPEEYTGPAPFRNLLRWHFDGSVAWRCDLPTSGPDFYLEFKIKDSTIEAWSTSCFMTTIDLSNGRVLSKVFTK